MKTVIEIRDAIRDGSLKSEDIVRECLDKIKGEDKKIGAFLEIFDEEALASARRIDEMKAAGEELPRLAGVPIAIKDNILIKGHTVSAGSKMLEKHVATYDATVIERLRAAGAIFIGRTNCDEFAMGSSTENSFWQKTRNPVDTTKVPGGSSGGSAAAVAAGFVPVALGSDTGGSIRQPASLCGVTGMKPTYGRVSRYGLIAFASSFDQIGPIARTVEDCALILEVIQGGDEKDATSLNIDDTTIAELIEPSVQDIKIGVPKEFFIEGMDPEVKKRVEEAIDSLKNHGAEIVEISLPLAEYALPAYYIISPAEASSNLARFDGMRYGTRAQSDDLQESYVQNRGDGFGKEVKRRIMLGTYILSAGYYDAYYKKAQAVRTAIFNEMQEAFKEVDVIIGPTSPSVAWNMDEKFDDPITMYLSDIYTVTANIAGIPAISIPCGTADGLPVGLQIMGNVQDDAKVLQVAAAYQALNK
ncbi:MAG: Asp-tRNA(Asn)/Glu-tRNA(Gln) amidotransferase subunit GatA [Patescibacteria group bacterium]